MRTINTINELHAFLNERVNGYIRGDWAVDLSRDDLFRGNFDVTSLPNGTGESGNYEEVTIRYIGPVKD